MTFRTTVYLSEYFVDVCSRSVFSSECFSGISDPVQADFTLKCIWVYLWHHFADIEKFITNYLVDSYLSSFISIIHCFHFSLSGKESKGDVGAGLNTDEFANLIFNTDENLDKGVE
jgi:hypothetical protein